MTDPTTLNFHPDIAVSGDLVIDLIARRGTYRSQFETGTSSGGLTAYRADIAGDGKIKRLVAPMVRLTRRCAEVWSYEQSP